MLRISGGEWRGRLLKSPRGDAVRPTQERVREALFSMIRADIAGASVLDLYSGSGSVGLEALSRGAARAVFVDSCAAHLAVLKANLETLGAAARCECVRADAERWAETAGRGRAFDFVYADPPYALGRERRFAALMQALAASGAVRPGGIFAAEMAAAQSPDEPPGWTLCRDRRYGQTRIAVYTRGAAAPEGNECNE